MSKIPRKIRKTSVHSKPKQEQAVYGPPESSTISLKSLEAIELENESKAEVLSKSSSHSMAERNSSDTDQINEEPPLEGIEFPSKANVKKHLKLVALVFATITLLGLGAAYVISQEYTSNQTKSKVMPTRQEQNDSDKVCFTYQHTIGDEVCDDLTNIEECEYDGGDCCLPHKSTPLCNICDCKRTVDNGFLESSFEEHRVYQFLNTTQNGAMDVMVGIEVTDVVSIGVCAMLCFHPETVARANAWSYSNGSRTCSCSWIKTEVCWNEKSFNGLPITTLADIDHPEELTAFLLKSKVVSCNCIDFDNRLQDGEIDLTNQPSLFHCKKACLDNNGCTHFSFQNPNSEAQTFGACIGSGKANSDTVTDTDGWITGLATCDSFSQNTERTQTTKPLSSTSTTTDPTEATEPETTTTNTKSPGITTTTIADAITTTSTTANNPKCSTISTTIIDYTATPASAATVYSCPSTAEHAPSSTVQKLSPSTLSVSSVYHGNPSLWGPCNSVYGYTSQERDRFPWFEMDFGSWSNNVVTEVRIKSKMASGHKVLVRVGMNPSVQFELNQNPICNYHEWNNLGNGFDHNQGVDAVYNCPQPLPGRYVTVQLKDSRFDLFFQILSAEVFGYSDANSNVNIVSPLEDCLASFIGDQICDAKYNTEECTNDGGDCCNPESNFDSCHSLLDLSESNPCTCHLTGLGYYDGCNPKWLADHVCDRVNNKAGCAFDGGDCCDPTATCLDCDGGTGSENGCECQEEGTAVCLEANTALPQPVSTCKVTVAKSSENYIGNPMAYGPLNVIDGIVTWETFFITQDWQMWLEIEFACLIEIKGIYLTNRIFYYPGEWNFEVRVAGSRSDLQRPENLCLSLQSLVQSGEFVHDECCSSLVGKFVRFDYIPGTTNWQVSDVLVIDSAAKGQYQNRFLMTASSSSTYQDNDAYSAIDNFLVSNYLDNFDPHSQMKIFMTAYEHYPWLQLDLQSVKEVTWLVVTLCPEGNGKPLVQFKDVEITAGSDPAVVGELSTNQLCAKYDGPAKEGEQIAITCVEPKLGQYVILQINSSEVRSLQLCEVLLYAQ